VVADTNSCSVDTPSDSESESDTDSDDSEVDESGNPRQRSIARALKQAKRKVFSKCVVIVTCLESANEYPSPDRLLLLEICSCSSWMMKSESLFTSWSIVFKVQKGLEHQKYTDIEKNKPIAQAEYVSPLSQSALADQPGSCPNTRLRCSFLLLSRSNSPSSRLSISRSRPQSDGCTSLLERFADLTVSIPCPPNWRL
jgi:hypothetical protein